MNIRTLSIDIETVSDADLKKTGVYPYAESPGFGILLFGYAVNGGPVEVVDLACGESVPANVLAALTDDSVIKYAYNASFERICLSRYLSDLGLPLRPSGDSSSKYLSPEGWRCTMVWAATLGLPLSLSEAGAALGLDKQKMSEGKELIRYFCVAGHKPQDAPDRWATFKAYNRRDVETEMAIQARLRSFPVPDDVWKQYHIDQEINDRGILLDMNLVHSAISLDEQSKVELTAQLRTLTGLENPNSVQKMKSWLSEHGLETETLGKKAVAKLMSNCPEELRKVLQLRGQLAKSSIKKYQAMETAVCSDGRARGTFQFYGANRTGRFSGRLIQLQNLAKNEMPDLTSARALVRTGDYEMTKALYDDVPDTLSQLVRTAFIAPEGKLLYVADYSAIEARVLAWLAGEQWVLDTFAAGGDIYCETASRMFHVPVVKNGENGHLRQKGKQATLSCIAEGSLVLTDQGLVPIQNVTKEMRVWDGETWVRHDGVVYKGERKIISYEGLTATPDHLVWVEGQPEPIQFGLAAASGAHLIQTGDGGKAIRFSEDHLSRKEMVVQMESLLCPDQMRKLWFCAMDGSRKSEDRKIKRLPAVFETAENTAVAESPTDCGETQMYSAEGSRIQKLWCSGNQVRLSERDCCRVIPHSGVRDSGQKARYRSDRFERELCCGKPPICEQTRELRKSTSECAYILRSDVLAVLLQCGNSKTLCGKDPGGNYRRRDESCSGETKKLAADKCAARVYDIRNAGRNHRFTVSGKLVHNCGYGGSVGALKAMGALESGMKEEELKPLVDAWREANPHIVRLWRDVEDAAITAVSRKTGVETHGLLFEYKASMLFIRLPSGRRLSYVQPEISMNKFGEPALTYMGVGMTKKWERQETFGGKLVENCVAEDTLICTRRGLIPIQAILPSEEIWDGIEWVQHDGLISKGIQETISVNGLRLTPEHRILTTKGWIECGKAGKGFDWATVCLPDCSKPSREYQKRESPMALPMCLRKDQSDTVILSSLKESPGKIMLLHAWQNDFAETDKTRNVTPPGIRRMAFDEATLRRPKPSCLQELWWAWDNCLSGMVSKLRGILARYGFIMAEGTGSRPHQQQCRILSRKLPLDNSKKQQSKQTNKSDSRQSIWKNDCVRALRAYKNRCDDTIIQAESQLADRVIVCQARLPQQVYDIRNCGPRHRFAVWDNGKLRIVSNCTQAVARDILCYAMETLRDYSVVAHVHDELIIEADPSTSLEELCEKMAIVPPWAEGLILRADGYVTPFYLKN